MRAEDAPKRCRVDAATFNQDEWPERNEGPGFLGIGAGAERRAAETSGRSRAERLILIDGDSEDVAVGSVIVAESAVLPRGAAPGTINCTLNSLVIAPKMRGGGHGRTLTDASRPMGDGTHERGGGHGVVRQASARAVRGPVRVRVRAAREG